MTAIDKVQYLQIGVQGENAAMNVELDMTAWAEQYPDATFHILFKPYNESEVSPQTSTYDSSTHVLTWTVGAGATAIVGVGYTEVRAQDGGNLIKKTRIIPTAVENSVSGVEVNPPAAYADWVTNVLNAGAAVVALSHGTEISFSISDGGHLVYSYTDEDEETVTVDLGPVDAYAVAVEAGYSRTRAQFEDELAHMKDYSDIAEAAAEAAEICKNYAQTFVGAPRTAATADDMTDENLIYVFTGTTTASLTNGHWYFYDGEEWSDGGVYNSTALTTDTTLTVSGAAADAKVAGDKLTELKSAISVKDSADSILFNRKNAVDSEHITTNCRIKTADGSQSTNANYFATDYIPVRPGMTIWINHTFESSTYGTAFYDEKKVFVPGSGNPGARAIVTVPDGAAYARISFNNSVTNAAVYIVNDTTNAILEMQEIEGMIWEPIKTLSMSQGSLSTSTGANVTSDTRVRSDFYAVTKTPLFLHITAGYKAGYRIYNSNTVDSYTNEYSELLTSDTAIPVKIGQYVRILVAKTDDSNIQPAEINGYYPLVISNLDTGNGTPFTIPNAEFTKNELDNLCRFIEEATGVKNYIWEIGYIPTTTTDVDRTDVRYSKNWRHCVVACSEGDSFFINAVYCSTTKRPYSFIASDGTVLEQRQRNSAQNMTITAPAGSAFLVCNSGPDQNDEWICKLHTPNSDINSEGDQDILNKIQQLARARRVNKVMQTPPLVLLHFSDIHADSINLNRIMKFYGGHSKYINDVIHTGDSVDDQFSDGFSFWGAVEGTENVLNIIGNHDSNVKDGGTNNWYAKTEAECYETYIEPYVSNWGVTSTEDHCYYYKDYPTNNVRLICLDAMHMTDDQLSWFTNALAGAKTAGYHVVVASHMRGHWPHTPYSTGFDDTFLTSMAQPSFNPNYREYMVAAYSDAVQDFIDGGGNFCCWIGGHTHYDVFAKLDRHPDQLQVCVGLSGIANANNSAAMRVRGTKSEDLFNVLAVDTYSKIVKIVRVGEDYNLMMQHKNTVCYSYDTHELIV